MIKFLKKQVQRLLWKFKPRIGNLRGKYTTAIMMTRLKMHFTVAFQP